MKTNFGTQYIFYIWIRCNPTYDSGSNLEESEAETSSRGATSAPTIYQDIDIDRDSNSQLKCYTTRLNIFERLPWGGKHTF